MLCHWVLCCEALLDFVGCVKGHKHKPLLIFDGLEFSPRGKLSGLSLGVRDYFKECVIVHVDLLTFISHLQHRVVELYVKLFYLSLLSVIKLTQIDFALSLVRLLLFFAALEKFFHHLWSFQIVSLVAEIWVDIVTSSLIFFLPNLFKLPFNIIGYQQVLYSLLL